MRLIGKDEEKRMNKKVCLLLCALLTVLPAGCGAAGAGNSQNPAPAVTEETVREEKGEGVMTHEEYVAAEIDTPVVVETYVQGVQSLWEESVCLYTQDHEGGYFIYSMPCTEEEYEKLVPGQKIRVSGTKSDWCGEIEIIDASFELEEGSYIAPALDVTKMLGKDELIQYQNRFVRFEGLRVEPVKGSDTPFLYKWDGSGKEGDNLYVTLSKDGQLFSFTVESDLCGSDTDVYQAVKKLEAGDVVDVEGFLYWYEGVNPHITSVTVR